MDRARHDDTGSLRLDPDPDLDRPALAARLAERGRVQVHGVLAPESAARMERCLAEEVPWSFTWYDGEAACIIDHGDLEKLSDGDWSALQKKLFLTARERFAYAYFFYPMEAPAGTTREEESLLHDFFAFLNGPEMLELVGDLLGHRRARSADAQATRFGPSHFLAYHNDLAPGAERLCAYVFNFTPRWRPDWGGYLQFFDAAGNGTDAFAPGFNTLNIFTVPQPHALTLVTPFAGGYRYAVSGWYRAEKKKDTP